MTLLNLDLLKVQSAIFGVKHAKELNSEVAYRDY